MPIAPQMSDLDKALLEKFGPMSNPQAINAPEIPDFVKQAIMERSASPRPQGMAGVYDRAMNENLNIPMNIKALAGINPDVANQFMQSTQGMAMANRYGNTPEERAQRDKMMAAVGIGGQQLAAAGDTNRAIAANNVGLRNSDANMLGGIGSGANQRAISEFESEGENTRAQAQRDFLKSMQGTRFNQEKELADTARKNSREDKALEASMGDAKFALENIQQQARLAEERVSQMVQNGSITEEQAKEELNRIQSQATEESQKAIQASQSARNRLLTGDVSNLTPYMPGRISGPSAASGVKSAVLEKILSDTYANAQPDFGASIGWGNSATRNFVKALPESFGKDKQAKEALKKFARQNVIGSDFEEAGNQSIKDKVYEALVSNWGLGALLPREQADVERKVR